MRLDIADLSNKGFLGFYPLYIGRGVRTPVDPAVSTTCSLTPGVRDLRTELYARRDALMERMGCLAQSKTWTFCVLVDVRLQQ